MKELDNVGEYVTALLKANGVSVVTAEDGWVFTFTKEKLRSLVENGEESENIMIFVKSSANGVVN